MKDSRLIQDTLDLSLDCMQSSLSLHLALLDLKRDLGNLLSGFAHKALKDKLESCIDGHLTKWEDSGALLLQRVERVREFRRHLTETESLRFLKAQELSTMANI